MNPSQTNPSTVLWTGLEFNAEHRKLIASTLALPFSEFPTLAPLTPREITRPEERLALLDTLIENYSPTKQQSSLLELFKAETLFGINPIARHTKEFTQALVSAGTEGFITPEETFENLKSLGRAVPEFRQDIQREAFLRAGADIFWRNNLVIEFALEDFFATPQKENALRVLSALNKGYQEKSITPQKCLKTIDSVAEALPDLAEIVYETAFYGVDAKENFLRASLDLKFRQAYLNNHGSSQSLQEFARAILEAETAGALEPQEREERIKGLLSAHPTEWRTIYAGVCGGARFNGHRARTYAYRWALKTFEETPDASHAKELLRTLKAAPLPTSAKKTTRQDLAAKYPDFGFKKSGLSVRLGRLTQTVGGFFHRVQKSALRHLPRPFSLQ